MNVPFPRAASLAARRPFGGKHGASINAYVVRQCITKGAFGELRAACVKQGDPLTGEFLDLEGEIDNFAAQWEKICRHMACRSEWGSTPV